MKKHSLEGVRSRGTAKWLSNGVDNECKINYLGKIHIENVLSGESWQDATDETCIALNFYT